MLIVVAFTSLVFVVNATGSVQCKELNREDYTKIVWTAIAEFPGINFTCKLYTFKCDLHTWK